MITSAQNQSIENVSIPDVLNAGIAVFRGRNGKNEVVSATKTICALQTRLTMPVGYTNVENYIPLRQRR